VCSLTRINLFIKKYLYLFAYPVGYTNKDVLYRWNSRAVVISDDLKMSQFDLIDVPSSNESIRVGEDYTGKETGKCSNCY